MSGDHTPTPWAVWNVPVVNDKFHRKLGPMIILTGHDDDIVFAAEAVNSYASSQAEIERLKGALQTIASRADGYSHGDDHVTAAFAGIANIALAALSGSKD